jgi:hypothetical protein
MELPLGDDEEGIFSRVGGLSALCKNLFGGVNFGFAVKYSLI